VANRTKRTGPPQFSTALAEQIADAIRKGPQPSTSGLANTHRATFSIPHQLAADLATVSRRVRVSQSALLTLLLEEPIGMLAKLVALLPADEAELDEAGAQRLRGTTQVFLRARIAQMLDEAQKLDPGLKL
jgi:hypothetical protein